MSWYATKLSFEYTLSFVQKQKGRFWFLDLILIFIKRYRSWNLLSFKCRPLESAKWYCLLDNNRYLLSLASPTLSESGTLKYILPVASEAILCNQDTIKPDVFWLLNILFSKVWHEVLQKLSSLASIKKTIPVS